MAPDRHPEVNQLSAWLEGSLSGTAVEPLIRHLSICSECRQVAACASGLMHAAGSGRPPRAVAATPAWRPRLALAASAILVAALAWTLASLPAPSATAPPSGTRSAAPQSPAAPRLPHTRLHPPLNRPRRSPAPAPLHAVAPATFQGAPAALLTATAPPLPPPRAPVHLDAPALGFADQAPQFGAQQALAAWGGATPMLPLTTQPALVSRLSYAGDETLDFHQAAGAVLNSAMGMSWAGDLTSAAPAALRIDGVSMLVEAVAGSGYRAGGRSDQVYTSSDGGAHWRLITLPALGRSASSLSGIRFTSAQEGMIRDRRGDVWITHDGGTTWARR